MKKFTYVFFLALSSVRELSIIFKFELDPILSLIHLFLLIAALVGYVLDVLPNWVWKGGLGLVGLSSFIFMLCGFIINTHDQTLNEINSFVCLFIWYKSIQYLNIHQDI